MQVKESCPQIPLWFCTQIIFFFQQHCTTFLKMDVSTVIVCFKAAIKKEQNQSCGSAQEPAEERSTWIQGVVSNIYAYQAIHSLWPAVYSCNFPRQICYFTHHPASAKRKIYQHANKCLYEEETNISLSEIKIKHQWHSCQMFMCT